MKNHTLKLLICITFLFIGSSQRASASHILGAELTYTRIPGPIDSYLIVLTMYGDCGSTSGNFRTLPVATPNICIWDDTTLVSASLLGFPNPLVLSLPNPQCGAEVTPLCSSSVSNCTSLSSPIIGVMKFTFSARIKLPYPSSKWRFIYTGDNGSTTRSFSCTGVLGSDTLAPVMAGRADAITNISSPGSSFIRLIDTLNNLVGPNSSCQFQIPPPPSFLNSTLNTYFPDAIDPDGDSLNFSLINVTTQSGGCVLTTSIVFYLYGLSGANPLQVSGTLGFNSANGTISFTPNAIQRSTVVYNTREFRGGVFVGNSQREMNFLVLSADTATAGTPCFGIPYGGVINISRGCGIDPDTLSLIDIFAGCGINYQWQSSSDNITWSNISGATDQNYIFTPTATSYFRCAAYCTFSGLTGYSNILYIPISSMRILQCTITTPSDTFCNGPIFNLSACGGSSGYNVTTYFGDGDWNSVPLTGTPVSHASFLHAYNAPGTYSIYQVLYDGSTPIDTMNYSFDYEYCRTLPIKFYYDANSNCLFDGSDSYSYLPILTEVDSNGIAIDTISAVSGFYYKVYGGPGTIYTFKVIGTPGGMFVSCPSTATWSETILAIVDNYPTLYFGLECGSSSAFDLEEHAGFRAGPYRGFANIVVDNNYCLPQSATVTMTFSPKYIYGNAYPLPYSVSGNVVTWLVDSVMATRPPSFFNVQLRKATTTDLTIGDTVHSSYSVSPVIGDLDTANNTSNRIDTVMSSYDPNEISVMPQGYIYAGTTLEYTVNFENTGNAMAHNIYILDTLSDDLVLNSLRVTSSSAAMNVSRFNDGIYNIAKFDFPNINLLDSSHHNQCDGMVTYKILTKTDLVAGTVIPNHAGIFFDENPAVLTNTVRNIIGSPNDVNAIPKNDKVVIYPNPANDILNIKTTGTQYNSIIIYNTVGQIVKQQDITGHYIPVDIRALVSGYYIIQLKNDNGLLIRNFVKK